MYESVTTITHVSEPHDFLRRIIERAVQLIFDRDEADSTDSHFISFAVVSTIVKSVICHPQELEDDRIDHRDASTACEVDSEGLSIYGYVDLRD